MKITGIDEAINALKGVRISIQKRILKSALTFAIRPIKPAEQAAAPSGMGVLRRSIGVRIKVYKDSVFAAIGPLTKYKETTAGTFPFEGPRNLKPRIQKPSKYIHLIEGGTKPHFIPAPGFGKAKTMGGATGPGWQHHGAKAQPFIEATGARMRGPVQQRFAAHVIKRVAVEFNKAKAKGRKYWETDI